MGNVLADTLIYFFFAATREVFIYVHINKDGRFYFSYSFSVFVALEGLQLSSMEQPTSGGKSVRIPNRYISLS